MSMHMRRRTSFLIRTAAAASLVAAAVAGGLAAESTAGATTTDTVTTSPNPMHFGAVPVTTAAVKVESIVQQGTDGTLYLTSTDVAISGSKEFTITSGPTCGPVAPVTCTVTVQFLPTAPGTASAKLTVNGNFAGAPLSIPLTGIGTSAAAAVLPDPATFGTVQDTTSSTQVKLSVENTGNATLTVTTVVAPATTDFVIMADACLGTTVRPGTSCAVDVVFEPKSGQSGTRTSNLTVITSAGLVAARLEGTAQLSTPSFRVSPPSASYGAVTLGTTSPTETFVVRDTGTSNLLVDVVQVSASPSEFTIVSSTCTARSIAPGKTCSFVVGFNPQSTGVKSGTVTVSTSGGTQTVSLAGFGAAPEASVTPTLKFGTVPEGTQSPTQDVTVTDVGTAPLEISTVVIVGTDATDFMTVADGCMGITLDPGTSCQVAVAFLPSTSGPTPETALMQIFDDSGRVGSGAQQDVNLQGTGSNSLAGSLTFSPAAVNFGSVTVNTTASSTLTVSNTGTAPATITSLVVTGTNKSDFSYNSSTCSGTTLKIGTSCTIVATFSPSTTNTESADLIVTYSTATRTIQQGVALGGSGAAVGAVILSFSPDPVSFGDVVVGQSASTLVTVTNVSSGFVKTTPSLGGASSAFTLASGEDGCAGVTLPPGQSCSIGVTFAPMSEGAEQGTLVMSVGSAGPVQMDALEGSGITAELHVFRIWGQTADATAAKELSYQFTPTAGACPGSASVVLARDSFYSDALASQYLAGYLGTGTLLTPTSSLAPVTQNAIRDEGITHVFIVGGPDAVSTAVENSLKSLPAYQCGGVIARGSTVQVTRIWGTTQYDTAEAVAKYPGTAFVNSVNVASAYTGTNSTGGNGRFNDTAGRGSAAPASGSLRTAILATGESFQDAESSSVMAYHDHFPVLLTKTGSLSTQAKTAIKSLSIKQVIVMGGPFAVSNTVTTALQNLGVSVLRVAGIDATDTAVQAADFELSANGLKWTPVSGVVVARGDFYTDGLAGAVVAAGAGGTNTHAPEPMLLTENPSNVGPYLTSFLQVAGTTSGIAHDGLRVTTLVLLGGPFALTTATKTAMIEDLES